MPLPTPSEGQSEDDFIASCMSSDTMQKEFPDRKQRLAVCYSQFRKKRSVDPKDDVARAKNHFGISDEEWEALTEDLKQHYIEQLPPVGSRRGFVDSDPIPIFRTFEYKGKRYIHGYGAIFTSPDSHGTVMTRDVVEASIEKVLKKFPAVRYMHYKPFAQILFDGEIDNIRTRLNDEGFYILGEVYPEAEAEWRMVKRGHWGLSWSMSPVGAKTELRRARDGKMYPHFVKGLIHEISVVDAPSHLDCAAYAIQRGVHSDHLGGVTRATSESEKGGSRYTGEKRNMEKEDIEEMFKEHDTKLMDDIKRMIEGKKANENLEKTLEERDAKLMRFFTEELQKIEKKQEPPSALETAYTKATAEIKKIEDTVTTLRSAVSALQSKGEDASSLEKRITALEKEKDSIVKAAAAAVGETVKDLDKRLSKVENVPDEKSPLTAVTKPYVRGYGVKAMLEAALEGGR